MLQQGLANRRLAASAAATAGASQRLSALYVGWELAT